jgi:hypothetical protein
VFLATTPTDRPDDDQARMDAQPHRQLDALLARQPGIEHGDRLHHPEPALDGPLGIIFMGVGIAEVDQQAIAQILGDVAVKALDHLGTRGLICQNHVAQLFRIQLAGQHRGVDQIAEQHRELAALCCRLMPCHTWSRSRRRVGGLALGLR